MHQVQPVLDFGDVHILLPGLFFVEHLCNNKSVIALVLLSVLFSQKKILDGLTHMATLTKVYYVVPK